MDPNATLRLVNEHLVKGDKRLAIDSCYALCVWILKGGFEPNWENYPKAAEFYKDWEEFNHGTL